MATNTITIVFEECDPAPAEGYRVKFRPIGSVEPYRVWPVNFQSSPAVFFAIGDPLNTDYEGTIEGDCGGGQFGPEVHWNAYAEDGSGSGSGGSESDPDVSGSGGGDPTYYRYEAEVYACTNCSEPIGTTIVASLSPSVILFKYYPPQFATGVVYRPIASSLLIQSDNLYGGPYNSCVLACAAGPPEG